MDLYLHKIVACIRTHLILKLFVLGVGDGHSEALVPFQLVQHGLHRLAAARHFE